MAKLTTKQNSLIHNLVQNIHHQQQKIQLVTERIKASQMDILLYQQKLNELNDDLNVKVAFIYQ